MLDRGIMNHCPPSDRNSWRHLLIALNAALPGNRDFTCKLAANPALWLGVHSAAIAGTAARLQVPARILRKARSLVPQATAIAANEERGCEALGCRIVTRLDPEFPEGLLDLDAPPPVLYCRGELPEGPGISIVGSRRSDGYGLEVSRLFARELSRHGLTIASGLALGIDAEAHRGALEAGGKTVAVLGCGIDIAYPYRNRGLLEEVAAHGAVISEFPLAAEPRGWRFPIRNRIIAALTCGTLVVRATPRSGSLITARHALDLGRDVYATPGNIFDERSAGPNTLIRDGALPIQHPREILESLPLTAQLRLEPADSRQPAAMDAPSVELDQRLSGLLETLPSGTEITEDEVVARFRIPLDEALAALLELELGGLVERRPGARYLRHARGSTERLRL